MVDLKDFRRELKVLTSEEIVETYLMNTNSKHVDESYKNTITECFLEKFQCSSDGFSLSIVGSAHLGFSLVEKKKDNKPRYRLFDATSDIDCAIISPKIYDMIWHEISVYLHQKPYFPYPQKKLGDYMAYGWLRPDHFPGSRARLMWCQTWWDCWRGLRILKRRKISGGLFYSKEHLARYLKRAVDDCKMYEEAQ